MDDNKFTLKETELENASQDNSCFKNQEILEVWKQQRYRCMWPNNIQYHSSVLALVKLYNKI